MTTTAPRKGTPEGDIFDGKVLAVVGIAAFIVASLIDMAPLGVLVGGILLVVGLVKYHAGHVRRP